MQTNRPVLLLQGHFQGGFAESRSRRGRSIRRGVVSGPHWSASYCPGLLLEWLETGSCPLISSRTPSGGSLSVCGGGCVLRRCNGKERNAEKKMWRLRVSRGDGRFMWFDPESNTRVPPSSHLWPVKVVKMIMISSVRAFGLFSRRRSVRLLIGCYERLPLWLVGKQGTQKTHVVLERFLASVILFDHCAHVCVFVCVCGGGHGFRLHHSTGPNPLVVEHMTNKPEREKVMQRLSRNSVRTFFTFNRFFFFFHFL